MISANQLRRQARIARQSLSPEQVFTLSTQACSHLFHHPWFRNSQNIAAFFACNGETNPEFLIQRAFKMDKRVYFPVLKTGLHNALWFHQYTSGQPLLRNRYNIPEPAPHPSTRIAPQSLDIILTPLVCFDEKGNRLGMGGGFYDRTFSFLRHRHHWRKPRLVGIAYEAQKVSNIQHNEWDVPLDAVITEKRLYLFNHK